MPANTPYSSLDFNQDGDISNLELAAARRQFGESSRRKKRPLLNHIFVGTCIILFGMLFSLMGLQEPGILITGYIIAAIGAIYIVIAIVRHPKKPRADNK